MRYFKYLIAFYLVGMCLYNNSASAQEILPSQRLQYQKTIKNGMYTLLGWSLINVGGGLALNINASGSERHFHVMNAGWNVINLGLSTSSLIQQKKMKYLEMNDLVILNEARKMEKLFLINTGLDLAYISFGMYLHQRGKLINDDRLIGFGQSLWLQGGFLAVFDMAMFLIINKQSKQWFNNMSGFSFSPKSCGIVYSF